METLLELEMVQRMLSFMESRGLSSSHHHGGDADRFLAHFLLFMIKPCGTVHMETRCRLLSEHLPKISPEILEEAEIYITEEGILVTNPHQRYAEHPSECYLKSESDFYSAEPKVEDKPMVGLDGMQRANSTLEDFCRSYFMFHEMDPSKPQCLFKFLPVLAFTESYIYQLDIINESMSKCSLDGRVSMQCSGKGIKRKMTDSSPETSGPDPFDPFISLLQSHGLLTDRIRSELKLGARYWELERKLCHALASKKKILIEDVMRAIHLKSFDYRVLNLLLYQLRGQQVNLGYTSLLTLRLIEANDIHMEFLSVSEFLVEISDDLYDYEDDVVENSFNILRMFVGVYGASAAPSMLAKCISEAEEEYARLSLKLEPELSLKYSRRCEEATREGGTKSGHAFGTWNIPPVIADEESYRSQVLNLK